MAWYSGFTDALGGVTGGLIGTTKKPSTNLRYTAGTAQDLDRFAQPYNDSKTTIQQARDRAQREAGEQGRYLINQDAFRDPYAQQNLQRYGAESRAYRDFGRDVLASQRGSIAQLEDAAAGRAPSVAELMLQRSQGQTLGAAASARGANRGLALRNALGQQTAQQGELGMLRAQEQAQARQDLSTALANYGQLAAQQAGFYEQMGYNAQQAQLQANRDLEMYLANREVQLKGIQSGVGIAAENAQAQKQAAVLGAGATIGAAFAAPKAFASAVK